LLLLRRFDARRRPPANGRTAATTPSEIPHRTASVISSERIVFNIKGNDCWLVESMDFEKGIVWIKGIGTHNDYDSIDVKKVEHEKP
jgi:mRNA interferase HigB